MKRTITLLSAAILLLCTAQTSFAAKYELNMQSHYPPAHVSYRTVLTLWAQEVSAKNPDLNINLFANGAILESKEVQDGLINGMLDMAGWNPAMDPKAFPYAMLGQLPMLYNNSKEGTDLAWKMVEQIPEFKDSLDKGGLFLTIWGPATTGFFSVKTPVHTPADIKGKRVLIMMPSDSEAIKALGGIPVFVAPGDIYVGLQRGMGEMCYSAWPMANGMRLQEVCKYASDLPLQGSLLPVAMSKMVADHLPPEIVGIVTQSAGKDLAYRVSTSLDDDVVTCKERFLEAGGEIITLTEAEIAMFKASTQDLVKTYWIPYLKTLGIKNAEELVAKVYTLSNEVKTQ